MSANEIVREVFDKWVTGDLVEKQTDLKVEIEKARLEKLQLENKLLKIKIDFGENFQRPLSISGNRMITSNVKQIQDIQNESQSPFDELNNRLFCVNCGQLFDWINHNGFIDQIKEFTNHLLIKHNRNLNPLEKNVIDNLEYQGASK